MNAEADNAQTASDRVTKRHAKRDSLFLTATMVVKGLATPLTVRVRNLSNGGMMIDSNIMLSPGQAISTDLRGIGPVTGIIAWVEAGRAGIAFDNQVDPKLARHLSSVPHAAIMKAPTTPYERRPGLKPRS